jgi:glutaconate CoA-transferase subunit A
MIDKRISAERAISELRSGMTIGIGGWGSRRKPMALIRALLRSDVSDLTVVSYGGPDVGLLARAGKIKRLLYGFVSLDSIALEPHFRAARQKAAFEAIELDEGMLWWGLYAAALNLPFLPTRAGLGSDVMKSSGFKTVQSPYADEQQLVAVPAIKLDAALIHVSRADALGNGVILGPDPYFDKLFAQAASRCYMSCERVVETASLFDETDHKSASIARLHTHAVIESPGGAAFTECLPDYERDEGLQKLYAAGAKDEQAWARFEAAFGEAGS